MKMRFAITGIVWLACAAVMSSAPQAPSHVDLSKLPPPVRATIEAETRNATIKNVSKETEKGNVEYEVETTVNGKSRDFVVDPSGKVLEVENVIEVADAPTAVQDALKARGTVLKLETVQKNGTTTYEARVQGKSGRKASVALDANGKPIKG